MVYKRNISRRAFIGSTAAAITLTASSAVSRSTNKREESTNITTVPFGEYCISRLLVGGNPISGFSHVSKELDQEMIHYFTTSNVKKLLSRCERAGINTWQSRGDKHIRRLLLEYRDQGGTIQWIAQTASEFASFKRNIQDIVSMKPIGIYHHGSRTDKYWQNGAIEKIKDDIKIMKDTGIRTGIASHIPEALEYFEDHDWDVDFYMTCFYNVNKRINGEEAYLADDRERMCKFIQQTPKQCFAFKILAAGRNATTPDAVRKAFEFSFANIKPGDVVNVGMFPKYSDQVSENFGIVKNILN